MLGVRHVQLVHYIRNPIGDFQTEKPEHKGLTDCGKKVVVEPAIASAFLIDLAHCHRARWSSRRSPSPRRR